MEDFIIRKYREGDEVEINRLFNEIFGDTRSLEEWRWKFEHDPSNTMMIAVAESAGRIVGQYAVILEFFRYLNKVVLVAIPVDNFVHPQFRGGMKGVQKALLEFQDQLCQHVFGFGFPNREAYIVGKRILTYKDVGKMPVLFKRLNFRLAVHNRMPWMPSFLLSVVQSASNFGFRSSVKARKSLAASAVTIRMVDSFDERIDALWDRVKEKHKVICVRDLRFLRWRYSKPGAGYRIAIAEKGEELLGYVVTSVKHDGGAIVGYIVDLLTDESLGVDAALVSHSVLELLSKNADHALCWMLPDKEVFRSLREAGFAQKEDAFPSVNIVFKIYAAQAVAEEVLKDPKNWYLTMGDLDNF